LPNQVRQLQTNIRFKGGLIGIDEVETCPAGLGRGKHALGVGWVSLG